VLRSIPLWCLAAALVFWAYHLVLVRLPPEVPLGSLSVHHVRPLHALPERSVSVPWLLQGMAIVAAFVLWVVPRFLDETLPPRRLLPLAALGFVALGLSVAMIDGYRVLWDGRRLPAFLEPYTRSNLEYYADVPKVEAAGVRSFLRKFAEPRLREHLAGHSQTHPPGPILFLWAVSRAFGPGLWPASLATILFSSLAVFPLYGIARHLYEGRVARYALALFLLMPNVVMFSTTGMDGVFAVFVTASAFFFLRATSVAAAAPVRDAVLAGALLSCAMLMTYAAAFLVLFLGMLSVLALRKDRRRLGRLAAAGAAGALVCIAVHVLLFLTTGFDPVKTFQAAIAFDQEAMAKNDGSPLRSLNVGVANLAAFLASVGVPVTVAWAGEIGAAARRLRLAQEGDLVLLGYVASLVLIAFSTLFTLEVERVWLFMAPFVAAPAAHYLHGRYLEGDRSALRWTFGLLALQLVAFEALLRTPW
jgi:hypothetical protein